MHGSPKATVPEDKLVVSSLVRPRAEKGRNNRQRSPSPSPTRKSSDTDDTGRKFRDTGDEQKGTSSSGATDKPLCFKFKQGMCDKEKTCLDWHPLECIFQKRKALSTPDDKNTIRKESISIAITTHGVEGDSTQSIFQGIRSISSECRKKTKSQLRSVTKIRAGVLCSS